MLNSFLIFSFAHVQFSSAAARDAAIAKSESELCGRNLLIKDANDYKRSGEPSRNAKRSRDEGPQNNEPSATLFLKNLAFSCPEEDIRSHFEQYGSVVSVRIPMIPGTDRRKGFGYVEFSNKDSALKAMESGKSINFSGRDCFLEFAAEKKTRF